MPHSGRSARAHQLDAGQRARAQGCLLGQLAGDSLGGLVEFRSAASIKRQYPGGVRRLADGGRWGILAGQPTDDSEMALMLARSLADTGRFDPAAVLDRYVHWYQSDPFDMGGTTAAALGPAAHAPPHERLAAAAAHASQSSQANGSLMRTSPLGIFGVGRTEAAAAWARADSRLTHPHRVCQDACAVFVVAIAAAIAEGLGPPGCYGAALAEAVRSDVDPSVFRTLEEAGRRPPADYQSQQGWVLIALQNAFYRLLNANDLEEAVVETVMCGGDTDTNAAIAGALAGAVYGRNAVPRQWQQRILACRPGPGCGDHPRPKEFWPADALELAERLLAAATAASPAR